jgi:tetratricopeptide (TPR) repeat protein
LRRQFYTDKKSEKVGMSANAAITWIDRLLFPETGKHLNDLQIFTIEQVLLGRKYVEIAEDYHCTEGHVKDIAAALWQILSQLVGERVTKTNLRSIVQRHGSTVGSTPPLGTDYQFIGRDGEIARIAELAQQGQRTIVIQGEGGVGKTTLAQQYLKTCGCDLVLELLMAKETAQITPAEIVVEEWLRQDLQIEPGREFGVSLLRLKRQLSSRKIGILIDNLEPALDRDGRVISTQRGYLELFRILTDRQLLGMTLITSRDKLCEAELNLIHYRLSGLNLDTWHSYFNYRQIPTSIDEVKLFHQNYGGNAKAMEIIVGNIWADFDGDIVAYTQANLDVQEIETSLQQPIANQFDRLQQLDPDAYQLLCRAGCYRYQDLARVHGDALACLLWDVEPRQRQKIITALKNRSLIEAHRGEYWLHPAIRAEGIARLRTTDHWIEANHQAAKVWTDSVTKLIDLPAATTALEAYYHYLEIDDFDRAAQVLLKPRDNQWGQFLPLASSLYRMGLIQPALAAITQILPSLPLSRQHAELSNILGDLYWIIGRVHEAIEMQQQAIICADNCASKLDKEHNFHDLYCLQILEIDSLLSMGLYHIDLWELTAASSLFERVIQLADQTNHDRWAQKAKICLALVRSVLGDLDLASQLLIEIEPLITQKKWTGSSAYFLQIIGQAYTNLGDYHRAETIYQQTLTFCQTGNYLQTQARTLTGLAQIQRLQGNLAAARQTHLQAIEILDQIGAKCDLAEAYYQAGLTWHQAGDFNQAQVYWQVYADRLFTEIAAPQQLAKLKLAMEI